ncbi:MAG: hypothetical protein AAF581_00260 [Planctomycetota bacterium]
MSTARLTVSSSLLPHALAVSFVATLFFCWPAPALGADDDYPEVVSWLRKLLPKEIERAQYLRSTTKYSGYPDGGFLLERTDGPNTIYLVSGSETAIAKNDLGTSYVGFEQQDVLTWIDTVRTRDVAELEDRHLSIRGRHGRARLFSLAIALVICDGRGDRLRAGELYELLVADLSPRSRGTGQKTANTAAPDVVSALQGALGTLDIWDIMLQFKEARNTRSDLLRRCQRFIELFPHNQYVERAQETAALLERMIAEDKTHETPEDLAALPLKDRIDELIFQLRDQTGHQMSEPGWVSIIGYAARNKGSAQDLVALGYDAVPQLIEALDDPRLSRAVGCHRSFHFSHRPITIGECCSQILRKITGESFHVYRARGQEPDETARDLAREWWRKYQERGERGLLVDRVVAAGGRDVSQLARRLATSYPEVALDAIRQAIEATSDDNAKARLVATLHDVPGAEVDEYVTAIAKQRGFRQVRIAALYALQQRGADSAEGLLLSALEDVPWSNLESRGFGRSSVIRAVLNQRSPAALAAVQGVWDQLPVGLRFQLEDGLRRNGGRFGRRHDDAQTTSPEYEAAREKMLVAMLDDTSRSGSSGSRPGVERYQQPRLCDFAAVTLSRAWPERYSFTYGKSQQHRDVGIIECRNAYLQAHGRPSQEVPERVRITPLAPAQFAPLVDAIVKADTPANLEWATLALRENGLNALGALHQYLWTPGTGVAPLSADARQRLELLEQELSWYPREVITSDEVRKSWPGVVRWTHADAWASPAAGVLSCVDSLRKAGNALRSIEFRIQRSGDLTGATLTIGVAQSRGSGNPGFSYRSANGSGYTGLDLDSAEGRASLSERIESMFACPIEDEVHLVLSFRLP